MANYRYKAMNEKGEKIEGVYTAASKEAIIEMISSNNYYPLKIEEVTEGIKLDFSSFYKVKTKDIAIFCRQFYTMLDAGVSINGALRILSEQLPKKKLREAIGSVEDGVRRGLTLSEAMREQGKIFPELLLSMVETGEMSGNLDTIMKRMSNHYEKENKLNNKIRSAMIYPMILGIVSILVIAFIIAFIMPVFVGMFTSSGTKLPASTRMLLEVSEGLKKDWFFIGSIFIVIVLGIRFYFRSDSGVLFANRAKLKLPILKGLNEKIIVSRFTRTLSTVIASGVPLVQGLQVVSGVVGNKIVQAELSKVREKVIKGDGLADPLREIPYFPKMLSSMVKIGEESGSLDEILNKTADFYDEELDTAINTFTALIEPLMIIIMAVVIGFLIISIIQPLFGMYNTIQ